MEKRISWRWGDETRRGVEERVTRRGVMVLCDQREPGRVAGSRWARFRYCSSAKDSGVGSQISRLERLWSGKKRERPVVYDLKRTKRNPASGQDCLWSAGLSTMWAIAGRIAASARRGGKGGSARG